MELYREIVKSFPKIEKLFTKEYLLSFAHTHPNYLKEYQWGLGTMIRLKLLGPQKPLYKKFIEEGFVSRDEMSMKIILEFYKHIRAKYKLLAR